MRRTDKAEMHFLRVVTGYRMMAHKHNEDISKKPGITNVNTIIKNCQKKGSPKTKSWRGYISINQRSDVSMEGTILVLTNGMGQNLIHDVDNKVHN